MKVTSEQLQQIIREESIRLKKRMMLESEKASILKKLQEIEGCDECMVDEINLNPFKGPISFKTDPAIKRQEALKKN